MDPFRVGLITVVGGIIATFIIVLAAADLRRAPSPASGEPATGAIHELDQPFGSPEQLPMPLPPSRN
jgi:hypothetical protein